jgi:hypothetical protein
VVFAALVVFAVLVMFAVLEAPARVSRSSKIQW